MFHALNEMSSVKSTSNEAYLTNPRLITSNQCKIPIGLVIAHLISAQGHRGVAITRIDRQSVHGTPIDPLKIQPTTFKMTVSPLVHSTSRHSLKDCSHERYPLHLTLRLVWSHTEQHRGGGLNLGRRMSQHVAATSVDSLRRTTL